MSESRNILQYYKQSQMRRKIASTAHTFTEAVKIHCGLIFVGFYALKNILIGVGG